MRADFRGMKAWGTDSCIIDVEPFERLNYIDMHNSATLRAVSFTNTMRPSIELDLLHDEGHAFSLTFEDCHAIEIEFDPDTFDGPDGIDYATISTLEGINYWEAPEGGPAYFEITMFMGVVQVRSSVVRFAWRPTD